MSVIGIDFGTSVSSVAVIVDGRVELLHASNGSTCIPSSVLFTPCKRLIGPTEQDWNEESYVDNYVLHVKRLLGINSQTLSHLYSKYAWPFYLEPCGADRVNVRVVYKQLERNFAPEQLAAMVMERLKQIAENRLNGQTVTEAVLTSPVSFNPCQRQALINAARIAGLRVVRLINAPTAAAIAYRLKLGCRVEQKLFVIDIGGGTTNMSVIHVHDDMFDVKASSGDCSLGGADFTDRLVEYFSAEFIKKHGRDLSRNRRAIERLRASCERAKCTLSVQSHAHIGLPDLHEGIYFSSRITRFQFEMLCQDLFNRIQYQLDFVMRESRCPQNTIDEIILLGGSSRIPKIQEIIAGYFEGRALNRQLTHDESAVFGTGIFAQAILNEATAGINGVGSLFSPYVTDVVAQSMGVEVQDGTLNPIIQRNKPLPIEATKIYTTSFDNQETISLKILAGDYLLAKYNTEVGTVTISGIPQLPAAKAKIRLTFSVDVNGLLQITSKAKIPARSESLSAQYTVKHDTVSLTDEQVEQMIQQAQKLLSEDQDNVKLEQAKQALLGYVSEKRKQLRRQYVMGKLSDAINAMFTEKYDDVVNWVRENPACSRFRYIQKQTELDVFWADVFDRVVENSLNNSQ